MIHMNIQVEETCRVRFVRGTVELPCPLQGPLAEHLCVFTNGKLFSRSGILAVVLQDDSPAHLSFCIFILTAPHK